MRIVATTICALALTGCASNLPYTIAIGDPKDAKATPGYVRPDYKECVLRLDDIVGQIASDYSSSKLDNVKSLQVALEKKLHEDSEVLKGCKNGKNTQVEQKGYYPIEEVAKKWLTSYAQDATDPDQALDRFREYVRSAQLVENLAQQKIKPGEKESNFTQNAFEAQSQWCGTALPTESSCDKERSLYHVETVLNASLDPGETAKDLYKHLLSDIVQVERAGIKRNQRYFVLGYEIPWDKERTLVRYGVTFYFREEEPKNEEALSKDNRSVQKGLVQLIGYDLIYANEATPAPFIAPAKGISKQADSDLPQQAGNEASPWKRNPWGITGYPFSLVIGLKNAAFEIAKLPFSTIAGLLFGRDGLNYPVENLRSAYDALYVEATTQTRRGAEWGLYRLLTETPLVGQLFQYNLGGDRSEPDELPQDIRRKIFLSRGIYGGNKWGQDTGLWTLFARQSYPTYDVYSPPYRHGTAIDVFWSMFNLSHGPAYNEARYVMDYAAPDDRLYLVGHSGGVQRSVAASRILSNLGYKVIKVVGIAGPSIGQAVVDTRYPEAFKEYLNTGKGANQDITSKIGNVAGAFTTLLDYSVIVPLKYTLGSLGGLVIGDREGAYLIADRFGFSNATIVEVERKPSSQHQTPMRLSFTDRLVFDAYIRNEFSTAFREDLEREDLPHEMDRPNAFPWER